MRIDLANLPTDTASLHEIIATQAAEASAREAELAAAKAGLVVKALELEKLRQQIAWLRRQQFGRSSEKIARTIEQLELKLEELETETPAATGGRASPAPATMIARRPMKATHWQRQRLHPLELAASALAQYRP
jgi:hypothetical protein